MLKPPGVKSHRHYEDQINAMAHALVQDVFGNIDTFVKAQGGATSAGDEVLAQFLMRIVGGAVFESLVDRPLNLGGKEEQYKYTLANFNNMKNNIANAVAEGFSQAMSQYSGHSTEYICQIGIMPESVNKEPC